MVLKTLPRPYKKTKAHMAPLFRYSQVCQRNRPPVFPSLSPISRAPICLSLRHPSLLPAFPTFLSFPSSTTLYDISARCLFFSHGPSSTTCAAFCTTLNRCAAYRPQNGHCFHSYVGKQGLATPSRMRATARELSRGCCARPLLVSNTWRYRAERESE